METERFARQQAKRICMQFFTDVQPPAGLQETLAVELTHAYQMGVESAITDIKSAAKKVEEATGQLNYTFRHLVTVAKEKDSHDS